MIYSTITTVDLYVAHAANAEDAIIISEYYNFVSNVGETRGFGSRGDQTGNLAAKFIVSEYKHDDTDEDKSDSSGESFRF